MNRRFFFRAIAAAGVVANSLSLARADGVALTRTPRDYEGPYYPLGPRNKTNDLIVGAARDRVLNFSGQVVDSSGAPLSAALFDFWHADPLGRYLHPNDRTPGERWADFLYWGEATTDQDGQFRFRTYVPGDFGTRPAHIHFKVWSNEKTLLTSQIYFAELGGPRGASRSDAASERQTVNIKDDGDNEVRAEFQIVL